MGIAEYIRPDNIVLGIGNTTRDELFRTLASSLAIGGLLDEPGVDLLVGKLIEREQLSTTGVGQGIAIPHASIEAIKEAVIVLGVIPSGVEFNSVDGKPVDVVFMIIGSQSIPRQHIQILAKIVRLCRNQELMKKIRSEASPNDVLSAIRMLES